MSDFPLVSILINNYNYGQFLGEAIDSALNQTYSNVEVIVVDDGSTDESRQVIARYSERIKPILKENGGQASAFNVGFAATKGDIICLLDSDDVFLPIKAQKIVEILGCRPELGWCFHPLKFIDAQGNPARLEASSEVFNRRSTEHDLRLQMRRGKLGSPFLIPATSGLCFSHHLLGQILPMPEAEEITLSDSYIKFAALGLGKGFALSDELALQRIHENNRFTFKGDSKKNAKIHLLTAYWMRKKFPDLSKFSNNIFVKGVGTYRDLKIEFFDLELDCQELIKEYLSLATWSDKLEMNSKLLYYHIKAWLPNIKSID